VSLPTRVGARSGATYQRLSVLACRLRWRVGGGGCTRGSADRRPGRSPRCRSSRRCPPTPPASGPPWADPPPPTDATAAQHREISESRSVERGRKRSASYHGAAGEGDGASRLQLFVEGSGRQALGDAQIHVYAALRVGLLHDVAPAGHLVLQRPCSYADLCLLVGTVGKKKVK
jgi:hypothetical protein